MYVLYSLSIQSKFILKQIHISSSQRQAKTDVTGNQDLLKTGPNKATNTVYVFPKVKILLKDLLQH